MPQFNRTPRSASTRLKAFIQAHPERAAKLLCASGLVVGQLRASALGKPQYYGELLGMLIKSAMPGTLSGLPVVGDLAASLPNVPSFHVPGTNIPVGPTAIFHGVQELGTGVIPGASNEKPGETPGADPLLMVGDAAAIGLLALHAEDLLHAIAGATTWAYKTGGPGEAI